jgi:hypothetical protein
METPKEYYYTYYSYEEYGRGYFGSRGCKCLPEEDVKYFGSFKDKTFKPTQKIILKSDYTTRAEADADEILLHDYYDVANNPHFANQAKQTSTKFRLPKEKTIELCRRNGKKSKELGLGVHGRTKEQMIESGKKGAQRCKELGVGVFGMTKEQKSEYGKKGGKIGGQKVKENKLGYMGRTMEQKIQDGKKGGQKTKELGVGICGMTKEKRSENGKKGTQKQKELGIGIYAITPEQRIENSKKGDKKAKELGVGIYSLTDEKRVELGKKTSSQKWMCTETGFISTPGPLAYYQKARGIDTSKRVRIE